MSAQHVRALPTASSARAPQRVGRQLWVWHPGSAASLVALAQRQDVDVLLIWVSPGFRGEPATVRRLTELRNRATAVGVRLDALGGDPSWLARPDVAVAWAREVRSSRLFARVHLDVEPQSLPNWSRDQKRLGGRLLTMLSQVRTVGLSVDADLPYWFWRVEAPDGGRLDEAVLRRLDGLTIMAYQARPELVTAVAARTLDAARRLHRGVYVGVNVGATGGDDAASSFTGQSPADVRAALVAVDRWCAAQLSCAGTAVHEESAVRRLFSARPLAPRATRSGYDQ